MDGETHDHDCGCDGHRLTRRGLMQGCGAGIALALAGGGVGTAAADHETETFGAIGDLLDGMPDNWGRWGEDDGLGVLNVLGSEDMFEGMQAASKRGKKRIQRFTLQAPMTGEGIDSLHGDGPATTTDTGDAMFPGRFPARRDNWADASDDTLALATQPIGEGGMVFADDAFISPLYLQGTTHADALGHGWYDGHIYNGKEASSTHAQKDFGIPVTGIDKLKEDTDDDDDFDPEIGDISQTFGLGNADISFAAEAGVAGRGVLLDVGRYKGSEGPEGNWLPLDTNQFEVAEPDAAITLDDLKATAEWQGVELQEHDILLIRTGAVERTLVDVDEDKEYEWNALGEPGLTYSDALVEWLHEMDIPYVGADNLAVEQIYQQVTEDDLNEGRKDLHGNYALPLHGALLRDLGVTINEVMNLRGLAAQCAEDGIYDFLFTAAPLKAQGGTGAPINPVVLKATDEKNEGDEGEQDDNGNGNGNGNGN